VHIKPNEKKTCYLNIFTIPDHFSLPADEILQELKPAMITE
jgi:hypothetical protein